MPGLTSIRSGGAQSDSCITRPSCATSSIGRASFSLWTITKAAEHGQAPEDTVEHLASVGRLGSFAPLFTDRVQPFDNDRGVKLDDTSTGNLAVFRPGTVAIAEGGGLQLVLGPRSVGIVGIRPAPSPRRLSPQSSLPTAGLEAEIRPARADGVLSAMFLYRHDPWQEIDLELLGAQPDRLLINVFYNPSDEGDRHNYGRRGTPVMIDLGFDTSAAGIRWFVDDELVFARDGDPTLVPHLPMRFFLNTWPIDAEAPAGRLDPGRLPVATTVRSMAVSSWLPPLGRSEHSPPSGR